MAKACLDAYRARNAIALADYWGHAFIVSGTVESERYVLRFHSAGANGKFGDDDDFVIEEDVTLPHGPQHNRRPNK